MLTNALPVNAAGLPAIAQGMAVMATPSDLATWAVWIGRTVADVAALLFVLPMPANFRPVFEDRIRQEVASELLACDLSDEEAEHIANVAWLAFDRQLSLHILHAPTSGTT